MLAPQLPLSDWMIALDKQLRDSSSFFDGRPVILDLTLISGEGINIQQIIDDLHARRIRIISVEGTDQIWPGHEAWGRPPMAVPRSDRVLNLIDDTTDSIEPQAFSLIIEQPVRSGQTIVCAKGDLTIIGSVGSGAELIAGGSIHIYGTLRGRAVAGLALHGGARIFCGRMEAELLAIDGIYKSADDMAPELQGRAVQAWLQGDTLQMAPLD